MHAILTALIWGLSLLSLAVAGVIATELVLIPTSIDIGEIVSGGLDPWREAAVAVGLFVALLVATALSLRLWHSARFKLLAAAMTVAEVACVGWFGIATYRDYF